MPTFECVTKPRESREQWAALKALRYRPTGM